MDSAGAFLKAERLKQNKTLKDIAEGTKVGIFTLDALESDKTALLPPEAYVRGFIKAYANELDISPDEVLAMYAARPAATGPGNRQAGRGKLAARGGRCDFLPRRLVRGARAGQPGRVRQAVGYGPRLLPLRDSRNLVRGLVHIVPDSIHSGAD